MRKGNKRNFRKRCLTCAKLRIKTTKDVSDVVSSGVIIVNFEYIFYFVLVILIKVCVHYFYVFHQKRALKML